eukprot:TRINITY_DN237_c0_g1_i2.p1 TRINITY_DN237_c0_g1~~TRINITY_DN237_c0_g1_i2.p1  ORF type:complete len:343 (-),score=59.72 TRINITY_DN237_c0_g1_i2:417-1445(-)
MAQHSQASYSGGASVLHQVPGVVMSPLAGGPMGGVSPAVGPGAQQAPSITSPPAPAECYDTDCNRPAVPSFLRVPFPEYPPVRRRAVIICISYRERGLRSCLEDGRRMEEYLRSLGYECLVLSDGRRGSILKAAFTRVDPVRDFRWPTKVNIIKALDWLMLTARPGDYMFLYFAGHGGSVPDLNGDEADALDETIWALDGTITDDLLYTVVSQRVPPNAVLNVLFDSCHSGSALDLPFVLDDSGRPHVDSTVVEALPGLVVMMSASADPEEAQSSTTLGHGLMTAAWLAAMKACGGSIRYLDLMARMRAMMATVPEAHRMKTQTPQLSCNIPADFTNARILV